MDAVAFYLDKIFNYDIETYQHCSRVAVVAYYIGQSVRLTKLEMQTLYYSSLLHDLGKVKIPKRILYKKSPLTKEEFAIVKNHTNVTSILSMGNKHLSNQIIDNIKFHHEFYNGQGYNLGLKGESIPIYSRIIAIADAFDAMVTHRPYKTKILSLQEARKEIMEHAGEQFDPYIVNKIFKKKTLLTEVK